MVRRILTFESVCTDKRIVRGADLAGAVSFLDGSIPAGETLGGSVSSVPEASLLQWILSQHPTHRDLINSHLRMPSTALHRFSITRPLLPPTNSKPGDVDWLVVDPRRPHETVVAECKRVKVIATGQDEGQERINKIESLGEGVLQANSLADHGFHRTFLVFLVVVDGRTRTLNNVVSRGMSQTTFDRVYDFPWRDRLKDDVGVMYLEVVQPTLRDVDWLAQVGVCVDRQARPREQSTQATNRVRELLRGS